MTTIQPSSLVIEAQPAQTGTGLVTLSDLPVGQAVTAAIASGSASNGDAVTDAGSAGDSAGFTVTSIVVSVPVWHRYTEQEIDELPPALRAGARKDGGFWDAEKTPADPSTPFAVPAKATVAVTVSATLATVGVATANLTLTGTGAWNTIDVAVFAVVGTASATPVVSQNPFGVMCLPGDRLSPTITIQAPHPATVLATLAPGSTGISTGISITQVTVRVPHRRDWTPDELLDLPPDMRDQAKKDGWIDYETGAQGPADTPLVVPPNSIVAVELAIAVPAETVPDDLSGTLTLLSTTWQRVDVPLRAVISDFSAVPLTDRVSVKQGIPSDPIDVVLASSFGPEADVHVGIYAADAGDVTIDGADARLTPNAGLTESVRVTVAPNAALGRYPVYLGQSYDVGLRVTAFDGIYDQRFALGLTLLPGSVTVSALQGSIVGLQNSTVTCQVNVVVSGGDKQLSFSAGALPNGVTMAPVTLPLSGAGTTPVTLSFAIAADAPTGEVVISISWDAGDGANSGVLSLPFTVQLQPESMTFTRRVVTSDELDGHVTLELDNSGIGTFSGTVTAYGVKSYDFTVKSVIRSADGQVAIAQQKSGSAYGTIDLGKPRDVTWSEPIDSPLSAVQWPAIRTATMTLDVKAEETGILSVAEDIVEAWLEFLASSALLAATGGVSAVILMGSELADIYGVRPSGPGGLLGLVTAAGASALLGPHVLIPVLVAGEVAGDTLVSNRRLQAPEIDLLSKVFGDTLPLDRIMLTNLSGLHGLEFTVPGVDNTDILVNFGDGCYHNPIGHIAPGRGYTEPGQLLVHEMTHAWQIANGAGDADYFWRVAIAKLAGNAAYFYGPAGQPWRKFGLEQQATIVEEWAVGTENRASPRSVPGRVATAQLDGTPPLPPPTDPPTHPVGKLKTDPYYGYIVNNITFGLP